MITLRMDYTTLIGLKKKNKKTEEFGVANIRISEED